MAGRDVPAGDQSGRHAAPRHSARPLDAPREPARLDTSRIPSLEPARRTGGSGSLLLLALGVTAAVVAWGYLVYLAIDLGTNARDGDRLAWWLLALATAGAIACLFIAMVLVMRFVQRLRANAAPAAPPRAPGGRRAAR